MTAWPQRRCYRVKAIVQGSIGHTGIEPEAFFNAIGHYPTKCGTAKRELFDDLVDDREKARWYCETKRFCGVEID